MSIRKKCLAFYVSLVLMASIYSFFQIPTRSYQTAKGAGGFRRSHDEYDCGCPRYGPPLETGRNASLCSDWSSSRGPGQNVIAYSIYGNPLNPAIMKQYYNGIENRLKEAAHFYEGWVVRLYHNAASDSNRYLRDLICNLYCEYPNFDPCQVNNLYPPASWGDVDEVATFTNRRDQQLLQRKIMQLFDLLATNENEREQSVKALPDWSKRSFDTLLIGKMWRFLPMTDTLVDDFLVRDVDSFILPREVAAVDQWRSNSTALIHSMRDHPSHNGAILAGLWGGSRRRGAQKLTQLFRQMLCWPPRNIWDYDQMLLRRVVWPQVLDNVMVHDSYHCRNPFLVSNCQVVPFPTQRNGRVFVGWGPTRSLTEVSYIMPCPRECRPKDHQDWTLC